MPRKKIKKNKPDTERQEEARLSKSTFILQIPKPLKTKKETEEIKEKTSLYVPSQYIFTDRIGFRPGKSSDQVLITKNIPELLKAIFKYGEVAKRYGETGLENDPSRQQIIVYTMVTCQDHLLWYQRSSPDDIKNNRFFGEARLQGELSVGFGGHKTRDDIQIGREELVFLKELLPVITDEVGTMIGLNHGLFSEVEEELGLMRQDLKDLKLLGAFYGKWIDDPLLPVQVHWVHTGIAAVLEIDPLMTQHLTFRTSEIAKTWWVPFKNVNKELEKRLNLWKAGKGPRVERWSEVLITEFWKDYSASSGV